MQGLPSAMPLQTEATDNLRSQTPAIEVHSLHRSRMAATSIIIISEAEIDTKDAFREKLSYLTLSMAVWLCSRGLGLPLLRMLTPVHSATRDLCPSNIIVYATLSSLH